MRVHTVELVSFDHGSEMEIWLNFESVSICDGAFFVFAAS